MERLLRKNSGRAVAAVLAILMALALLPALTTEAHAAPVGAVPYTGQIVQGDYTIETVTQLAYLAQAVNGTATSAAAYDYTGSTFTQIANLDTSLSDSYGTLPSWRGGASWIPIGGYSSSAPGGPFFNGAFSGADVVGTADPVYYTITNFYISATTTASNDSGWGLFGAVGPTGVITNVTLSGSITHDPASANTEYVGAIAGYSQGSVYDSQTAVTISAPQATGVGGIVGSIENTSSDPAANSTKIMYCSATGTLNGWARVGGIVGAVYCRAGGDGNVGVDNNSYIGGGITINSGSNAYSGGVVGYCQGWVSNSYAYGVTLTSLNTGHYLGGAAGLLQGTGGAVASIYNSYAAPIFSAQTDPGYDRPFMANVDNSNVLPVSGDTWMNDARYVQPPVPPNTGWGAWSNGTGAVTNWTDGTALGIVNTVSGGGTGAYVQGANYPILSWQDVGATRPYVSYTGVAGRTPGGTPSYPDTDPVGAIFVDGTYTGATHDGSKTYPYSTMDDAIAAAATWTGGVQVIYIRGLVTVTVATTWALPSGWIVQRSSTYPGYLFDVNLASGSPLELDLGSSAGTFTVDGNIKAFQDSPCSSLFYVEGIGTLDVTQYATLTNNYGSDGGAIQIYGGTVALNGGTITNNIAAVNGGGVTVLNGGTLTMHTGSITSNTAGNNGGGVSVYNTSIVNISGGIISGNIASRNGGGVEVGTNTGNFTVTGGTITHNTAGGTGAGVQVDATAVFTISPLTSTTIADVIYLVSGQYINVGATLYSIVAGSLTVQVPTPTVGTVVAQTASGYSIFSPNDLTVFAYAGDGHTFQRASGNTQITIAT